VRNANTTLFRARERFRQLYEQLEGPVPDGAHRCPSRAPAEIEKR
jgi:hypothetical protein